MSEKLYESLSVLMDNEASEFEVHHVLKESQNDDLCKVWSRYHLARAVLRNETDEVIDEGLSARILERLAEEDHHSANYDWREKTWVKPFAGVAVAAFVAAVVFLGAQNLPQLSGGDTSSPQLADVPRAADSPVLSVGQLVGNTLNAGYGKRFESVDADSGQDRQALQANLEARFNRYMMLHAEQATLNSSQGMMPFARVVQFETE